MSGKLLLKNGTVISMDPGVGDFRSGDVLIEGGKITSVGAQIPAGDANIIDASGMIVMPGLIDPHRHLWYGAQRALAYDGGLKLFSEVLWPKIGMAIEPQDVLVSMRGAIAELLNNGITTVLDWCHVMNSAEHAEAALQAHAESPLRVVFGFGPSIRRKEASAASDLEGDPWSEVRAVHSSVFAEHADRMKLALAIQGPDNDDLDVVTSDILTARDIGIPVTMHVGVPQGATAGAVEKLNDQGLLGNDLQFVHCSGTTDEEFKMVADAGAAVALSPSAEAVLGLGIPPTGRLVANGLCPAFGCDTVSSASGDQFDEARAGLLIARTLSQQDIYQRGGSVEGPEDLGFTARQALEAITINAAGSIWLDNFVGSLTPGKRADVILVRAADVNLAPVSNAYEALVCSAQGANVDTVIADGCVVKRAGAMCDIGLDDLAKELSHCRDRLFTASGYDGRWPHA